MSENILVTGGAGFIGSFLVDALVERGHRVRILDSLEPQVHGGERPSYLNPDAELIEGSVLDASVLERALEDVDVVYHEAAIVGVGQSMYDIRRYCEGNTVGAAALLEAVLGRRDRIRKMIVASSMSIYGEGAYVTGAGEARAPRMRTRAALERGEWELRDEQGELEPVPTSESKPLQPTSVYAVTKRDHEELFLSVGYAYGIPSVALRYFNVYGSRQALSNPYTGVGAIFSSRYLNGRAPVIYEDGRQTRDFVHVSDIVQANLLALDSDAADYEAVNVGTGRPTSVAELATIIGRELGHGDLPPEITGSFREGDIRHCYADITKAKTLLGYEPRVRFEDGVAELVGWVREQRAEDRFETARVELESKGLA